MPLYYSNLTIPYNLFHPTLNLTESWSYLTLYNTQPSLIPHLLQTHPQQDLIFYFTPILQYPPYNNTPISTLLHPIIPHPLQYLTLLQYFTLKGI